MKTLIYDELKENMDKAVLALERSFAKVRTGRASLGILDGIRVDYYGQPTPLNQVATLSVPESRLIVIAPWDNAAIGAIEKALQKSDLGLMPSNDGKVIRLRLPDLTEERRKELVKHLHAMTEDHRVAIRNVRRDGNEALKKLLKDKLISEDDQRRSQDEIQKLTDAEMQKLDQAAKVKEKEILELK